MAKVTRLAYSNLIDDAGVVLVPSSEEAAMPRAALTRSGLGDVWRTKAGWTIVAGTNATIDFDRGGVKQADIAAGYYATAASLAAAIVAALEVADPTPVWACSYTSNTFTISSDLAFTLLFGTGTFVFRGIGPDLGYAAADTASATSHAAASKSYQSRHWLDVDLGAAQSFAVGIVRGGNLSTSGTATLQAETTSMVGTGLGVQGGSPAFVQALAGTDPRVAFFASQSYRYLRLVMSDVSNSAGYVEIGVLYVGTYVQPSVLESIEFVKKKEHLSEIHYAIGGANHQLRRARRRVWEMVWKVGRTSSDVDLFDALDEAMRPGLNFFMSFDATDAPTTSTFYGFLRRGIDEPLQGGSLYNLPVEFAEALP